MTSRNQSLSSDDQGRQRKESLETSLVYAKKSLICMKMNLKSKEFSSEWFRNKTPLDTGARGNSEMACYTFNEKDAR